LRIHGNDGPTDRFQGWVILQDSRRDDVQLRLHLLPGESGLQPRQWEQALYVPGVFFGLTGPVWRPKLGVVRCGVKCLGHHADNLVEFAIQGDAPRIRAKAIDPHRVTDYDHMRRAGFIVGRSKSLEELVINVLRGGQFGSLVIGEKHGPPAISGDAFKAAALRAPVIKGCGTRGAEVGLFAAIEILGIGLKCGNAAPRPSRSPCENSAGWRASRIKGGSRES